MFPSIRNLFNNSIEAGIPAVPEPPTSEPGKPASIAVHKLDFEALGLPEYAHKYALVLDNVFTPADCQRLLAAAEASSEWQVVQLGGREIQYTDTSVRTGGRILYDDRVLADWILGKIRPYLGDIERVEDGYLHARFNTRHKPHGGPVKLKRLNERLRFLRYDKGNFFKPHCDGSYYTDDRKEVSYYTLQLYLNGSKDEVSGGATRFWSKKYSTRKSRPPGERNWVDVDARLGRILIFQQEGLLHSGEEVQSGMKLSLRTDIMYVEEAK